MISDQSVRISNFAICKKLLEMVCKKLGCDFVDLEIQFTNSEPMIDDSNIMHIPETNKLSKTLFAIMKLYIDNLQKISGINIDIETKADISNFLFNFSKSFTSWGTKSKYHDGNEFISQSLNQYPFIWTLTRAIFAPLLRSGIKNIKVIVGKSAYHDVAKYIKKDKGSYLFVNLEIESYPIRLAYMLYESLYALTEDPDQVLKSIFADADLKKKFLGFVEMSFDNNDDTSAFIANLSILSNSDALQDSFFYSSAQSNTSIKTAQSWESNWWLLGLFEKMLESSRGSDWTVYHKWKPFTDELNEKIEKERKRRGLDHLPYELLLRIQGDEFKTDNSKTLQSLLADDRIW